MLHRAIQVDPSNPEPYQRLITLVFAPKRDLRSAKKIVLLARENGANTYRLDLALSEAAVASRDQATAEAALLEAVKLRPNFQTYEALGLRLLGDSKLVRASFYLKKACEIDPKSAQAAYYLGVAEENGYRYASAERDYSHAVALEPKNPAYRARLESFQRKLAANLPASQP